VGVRLFFHMDGTAWGSRMVLKDWLCFFRRCPHPLPRPGPGPSLTPHEGVQPPAAKRGAAEKSCWLAPPSPSTIDKISPKKSSPKRGRGGGSPGARTNGGWQAPNCWLGRTLSPLGVAGVSFALKKALPGTTRHHAPSALRGGGAPAPQGKSAP